MVDKIKGPGQEFEKEQWITRPESGEGKDDGVGLLDGAAREAAGHLWKRGLSGERECRQH